MDSRVLPVERVEGPSPSGPPIHRPFYKIHLPHRHAWNVPPAMHRLTYLVGGAAVMAGASTVVYGPSWPLPMRITLLYVTLVAVLVAVAASTRATARRCRGMFGKGPVTGRVPWPFILLLWPYHLCVQIVCWFYRASSGERVFDQIADRLYLGGWPLSRAMLPSPNCAIVDVTNELLRWVSVPAYRPVLVFESWAPEPEAMEAAVEWALGQQAQGRDVFCHCTHGHGRSAVTAAAILMAMGKADTVEEALARLVKARPGVKPNYRQVAMLKEWAGRRSARKHKGT
ncbi:hypothetical protein ABPG77_011390 [Micractinium sp. CCAP 211/92]